MKEKHTPIHLKSKCRGNITSSALSNFSGSRVDNEMDWHSGDRIVLVESIGDGAMNVFAVVGYCLWYLPFIDI